MDLIKINLHSCCLAISINVITCLKTSINNPIKSDKPVTAVVDEFCGGSSEMSEPKLTKLDPLVIKKESFTRQEGYKINDPKFGHLGVPTAVKHHFLKSNSNFQVRLYRILGYFRGTKFLCFEH